MKKQRNSRQRQMILEAVRARNDHPTADQIYMDVRAKDDKISRGTVYRNLGTLSESGEITNVKASAAERYDLRQGRHYHIMCTSCGRVVDAPIEYKEDYDREIEEDTGFRINRHRLIFEGLCPECIDKNKKGR